MARTFSQMVSLGASAPAFDLPAANPLVDDIDGDHRRLDDYAEAEALVVVFTCNHCPYARHIEDALIETARDYQPHGVRFVAISSNDPTQYADDSFDEMGVRARQKAYPFPYLFDASQAVAKAYGALCTPDLFVYDAARRLVYRGRFDETRPGQGTAHGRDLRAALDQLLNGEPIAVEQLPAMGCNIKWKAG